MPSMTWLLESTSFSRGFLLRKIVGTVKPAQSMHQELGNSHPSPPTPRPICFLLAGAGEVICSPCFLALAMRNSELLGHTTYDSALLPGPLFICAVKLWGQMVFKASFRGSVWALWGRAVSLSGSPKQWLRDESGRCLYYLCPRCGSNPSWLYHSGKKVR